MIKKQSFFHVTNKEHFNEIVKGIMPTGKGLGGQDSGFYVWSSMNSAKHHQNQHAEDRKGAGDMIVEIELMPNQMTYPDLQPDLEVSDAIVGPLIVKHGDMLVGKEFRDKSKPEGENVFKVVKKSEEWGTLVLRDAQSGGGFRRYCAAKSGRAQALVDELFKTSPKFCNDLQKMMLDVLSGKVLEDSYHGNVTRMGVGNMAFKYTKPVRPKRIYIRDESGEYKLTWEDKSVNMSAVAPMIAAKRAR